ncbi:hypothetical protein VOA_000143 [Vibrio sp. RC586]|nr:hypothetical protein VOA_000143 [Vibrio sp. RC586]
MDMLVVQARTMSIAIKKVFTKPYNTRLSDIVTSFGKFCL